MVINKLISNNNMEEYNFDCASPFNNINGFYDRIGSIYRDPKCVFDLAMDSFAQAIYAKTSRENKIKDDKIVKKWINESSDKLSEEKSNFIINKIKYHLTEYKNLGKPIDCVCQVDNLIPKGLKKSFVENIKILENDVIRDIHPGTTNVINLVHPSLYCLVSERSTVTPLKINQKESMFEWKRKGETIKFKNNKKDNLLSDKFQWLPTDISIDNNYDVKLHSYINNLYSIKHNKLYDDIKQIIGKFIPLFEITLSRTMTETNHYHAFDMYDLYRRKF